MPRITPTLLAMVLLAAGIGFNLVRYPEVWEMAARAELTAGLPCAANPPESSHSAQANRPQATHPANRAASLPEQMKRDVRPVDASQAVPAPLEVARFAGDGTTSATCFVADQTAVPSPVAQEAEQLGTHSGAERQSSPRSLPLSGRSETLGTLASSTGHSAAVAEPVCCNGVCRLPSTPPGRSARDVPSAFTPGQQPKTGINLSPGDSAATTPKRPERPASADLVVPPQQGRIVIPGAEDSRLLANAAEPTSDSWQDPLAPVANGMALRRVRRLPPVDEIQHAPPQEPHTSLSEQAIPFYPTTPPS